MASIQTSINLHDGVTGPLRNMTNALNIAISSFESMQDTAANAVDIASLRQAREELARAENGLDRIEDSIRQADNAQERFNRDMRNGGSAAEGLLSKIKGIAAAAGGLAAINKLADLSDQMAGTTARLNLVVDGGDVEALQSQIMASANRARASYQSTADSVSRLGLMAKDAFGNTDELVQFSELINKQFTIAGTSASEASNAWIQLTQALASGVLRGDELNSIFEQAPTIIQTVADYLGVSVGEIRSMAAEGQITADVVKNAMFAAADDIDARFEQMPMTWGQVFTMVSNFALQALEPLLTGINWLANNIDIIGPIVLGVAGAVGVYAVVAYGATAATAALSAAQAALGAVMAFAVANPVGFVIMLIVALIGIFYAAVAAVNKFAGTNVSATGIIMAAFAVCGAFLYNTFLVPTQNGFANLANFIGNVFHNPVAAVKVLFYDMCLTVIGYIRNLAGAIEALINKIPGVSVSITGGLDRFYSGLQQAQQSVKDASGWTEYVSKMDYKDYSAAASAGYNYGSNLSSKLSGAFDLNGNSSLGGLSSSSVPTLDDVKANTADTATNTAAMRDALEVTGNEMKLLREIAEREAVNRFTTAEIKVEMTNNNTISSDQDLDGIITELEERVEESMAIAAEGVHT